MDERKNRVINHDKKVYREAFDFGTEFGDEGKQVTLQIYLTLLKKPEKFSLIKDEQVKNNVEFCEYLLKDNLEVFKYFSPEMQQELAQSVLFDIERLHKPATSEILSLAQQRLFEDIMNDELFEVKGHGKCSWSTFSEILKTKSEEFLSIQNHVFENNLYFCYNCYQKNHRVYMYFLPEIQQAFALYAICTCRDADIVTLANKRFWETNDVKENTNKSMINNDAEVIKNAHRTGIYFYKHTMSGELTNNMTHCDYDEFLSWICGSQRSFFAIKDEKLKSNITFCKECMSTPLSLMSYLYFSPEMQRELATYALSLDPEMIDLLPKPLEKEWVDYYKKLYLTTQYPIENSNRAFNETRLLNTFQLYKNDMPISMLRVLGEVKTGSTALVLDLLNRNDKLKHSVNFAKQCIELYPYSILCFAEEVQTHPDIIRYLKNLPADLHVIPDRFAYTNEFDINNVKVNPETFTCLKRLLPDDLEYRDGLLRSIQKIEDSFNNDIKEKNTTSQNNKVTAQSYKQYKEQKNGQNQHNNNYHNNRQNNGGYHKSNSGNRYNNRPRQNDNRYNNFKAPWQEQLQQMLKETKNNKNEMEED